MENYIGPFWSDGKVQSSVEFGQTPPKSALDAESRLHDSAYAHYSDLVHRMAADSIYEMRVSKLGGFAAFAGEAVLYGNQTLRAGSNLLDYSKYGPLGLVAGSLINDYHLFDYMNNSERYKKEVLAYYATDPGWFKDQPVQVAEASGDRVSRRFARSDDMGNEFGSQSVINRSNLNGGNTERETKYGLSRQDYAREIYYNPYLISGGRRRKKKIRYD